MKDINALPDGPQQLKQMIAQLQARNNYLEEQFRLAQQKRFGASSELHPAQADLFNEAETLIEEAPEQDVETIEYQRKKPTRQPLPKDLPRERVVHDIDHKQCDCCRGELHKMGEDVSESWSLSQLKLKLWNMSGQNIVADTVKKRKPRSG